MSATRRGAVIFGVMLVVLVGCAILTFGILPGAGVAVGLPVITVPGEAYNGALPSEQVNWTNTLTATVLADLAVWAFIFFAWRSSKGWTSEVPGRFQVWAETVGNFMYNQTKSFAGIRPIARWWLFPLAASIFVFLLAANWMKLLPGVESVGIMHCAHPGINGYASTQIGNNAYQLYVDQALYAGQGATEEDYHACEVFKEHPEAQPDQGARLRAANELREQEAALIASFNNDGAALTTEQQQQVNNLRLEVTETLYEHPGFTLSAAQLEAGVIPYIQVVTPFVRGAATDLNLTIGLALIVVVAIQIFGVAAQGPTYFQKFINLHALGTIQKKPLGAIDFIVGIFEIISELGKIISLAFRLFGNMFAGGILLAVMSFLVAIILPVVFYGLELIVTSIQAYVFAVLCLVFVAQAMEGHHSDDEHHEETGGHAAEEASPDAEPITRNAI